MSEFGADEEPNILQNSSSPPCYSQMVHRFFLSGIQWNQSPKASRCDHVWRKRVFGVFRETPRFFFTSADRSHWSWRLHLEELTFESGETWDPKIRRHPVSVFRRRACELAAAGRSWLQQTELICSAETAAALQPRLQLLWGKQEGNGTQTLLMLEEAEQDGDEIRLWRSLASRVWIQKHLDQTETCSSHVWMIRLNI